MSVPISLRSALALLVPPRCAACAAPCSAAEVLCALCEASLGACRATRLALPGLDLTLAAAGYEGVAREVVRGLKFGARTELAARAGQAIARALAPVPAGGRVVPVPPAPSRYRRRGFDPADELAVAVAAELGLPVARCLARSDGPRQVGRRRRERTHDPPRVSLRTPAPELAFVVDDVLTTGATLAACARALRSGGSGSVIGAAFARSLGAGAIGA
ncbi:MAG TPA: hypothetical protein VHJ54_09325 [Solirubrobacterales bacterium]|nr:hypothetical protein [Solirubrobacterales bacterium]